MTAERIERALDALAEFMVEEGAAGAVYLPIYQRLERELSAIRATDEAMGAVFQRAAKSKNQFGLPLVNGETTKRRRSI